MTTSWTSSGETVTVVTDQREGETDPEHQIRHEANVAIVMAAFPED